MNSSVATLCVILLVTLQNYSVFGLENSCSADADSNKKFVICNAALWYLNFGFAAKYIDPYLCTHISLSYVELHGNDFSIVMPGEDTEKRWKMVEEVVQLKRIKPDLQILASIGGWTDLDSGKHLKYYELESTLLMEAFLSNVINFVRQQGLDGIEFVWNYIGRGKSISDDVEQLAKIAKSLCTKLQRYGYLCMITLMGASKYDSASGNGNIFYDNLRSIIRDADIIGIWTADIPPEKGFFHSDMLRAPVDASKAVAENTVEHIVNFYMDKITLNLNTKDLRKMGMVIPMQTNGLRNSAPNTEPALGSGTSTIAQDHGPESNQISYRRICERLNNIEGDPLTFKLYDGAPFAVSKNKDVYFSVNTRAYVKEKVNFAMERGLGGIVVFQIGADDFLGRCENMSMPLLSSINAEIISNCKT